MNAQKLLLQLGRSTLRRLRSTPAKIETPKGSRKAPKILYKTRQTHIRHDPLLEDFSNQLLRTLRSRLCVQIFWNPKLRSTAGLAYPDKNIVVLNPKLLQISPAEVQRTLRHELAHLLAQHRNRRRSTPIPHHGAEWRTACKDLGIPNEPIYCNFFPPKRQKRSLFYHCPSCTTTLARVKPLHPQAACAKCCNKFNNGSYSKKFQYKKETLQKAA